MASKNYISPGGIQPNPKGASATSRNYISPGAVQPAKIQFAQRDWPNPTLWRGISISITSQPIGSARNVNVLIGKDKIYGNAGQVADYDWPNPHLVGGLPTPVLAQPLGAPRILNLLVGKDQLPVRNAYLIVNPTVASPRAIPITAQMMGSPRLENLLVGNDSLPVRQNSWPVPRGSAYDRAINSQTNGMVANEGTLSQPFNQYNWPNPTLRLSHMQALTAQPLGSSLNPTLLSGQDTFYGERGEVIDYSWPVPAGPPLFIIALESQPLGSPAALATVAAPFGQNDWPNPRALRQPQNIQQPLGSPLNLTLLPGQDALPFSKDDWPNPILAVSRIAAITAQPLGQSVPVEIAENGTAQYDWPIPRGPKPPTQTQPYGSPPLLTTLVGQDALAFSKDDWPNPTLGKTPWIAVKSQPIGSPLNLTLLVGQDILPFNQDQWPNPRLRLDPLPPTPLGTPDNVTLLPGQDAFPVRQQNWPVPHGPVPGEQTQPQGIPPLQLSPPAPTSQDDWPVPRGAQPRTQTQQLGSPVNLTLLPGQDRFPIRQQDWPNPRGPIPAIQTQSIGTTPFFLTPAPPFAQLSWPIPRGAQQPVQTQPYGSSRLLNLLVGKDSVPIRQQDWPLPRRAVALLPPQPLGVLLSPLAPFFQTEWPNPRAPWRLIDTQPLGRVITATVPTLPPLWPNPTWPAPTVALSAQPQGGVGPRQAPFVPYAQPNPMLGTSPLAALLAQLLGTAPLLNLYPGQDALPVRQQDWPVPPGWPPRTQTQRQGVSPNQRRPAPPPIINKPPLDGVNPPINLAASEIAPTLLGGEVPVNLSGNEDQANLAGEKSSDDLLGEVDQ